MGETVIEKGVRLHEEGRVSDPVDAKIYSVEGDSGTYEVTVSASRLPTCTCPATTVPCSHIYAVAHKRAFGGHVFDERA